MNFDKGRGWELSQTSSDNEGNRPVFGLPGPAVMAGWEVTGRNFSVQDPFVQRGTPQAQHVVDEALGQINLGLAVREQWKSLYGRDVEAATRLDLSSIRGLAQSRIPRPFNIVQADLGQLYRGPPQPGTANSNPVVQPHLGQSLRSRQLPFLDFEALRRRNARPSTIPRPFRPNPQPMEPRVNIYQPSPLSQASSTSGRPASSGDASEMEDVRRQSSGGSECRFLNWTITPDENSTGFGSGPPLLTWTLESERPLISWTFHTAVSECWLPNWAFRISASIDQTT
jgi:hypothetical protein